MTAGCAAVLATALLCATASPTSAAQRQCALGSAALDQYCETLPGAGGAQGTPGGLAPTVAPGTARPFLLQTLPRHVALALLRSHEPSRRDLLGLPAPYPRPRPAPAPVAARSPGPSLTALYLVLGAITVGMCIAAVARRRERPAPR